MRSNRNLIPPSTAFVCTTYLSYLEDFCGFSRLSPVLTALRGPEAMVGLREGGRGIPGAACLVVCGLLGRWGEICPPPHPVHPKWAPWTQATHLSPEGRPRLLSLPGPISRLFSQPPLLRLPQLSFLLSQAPACSAPVVPTPWQCPHLSSPFFLPVWILKHLSGRPGGPLCPNLKPCQNLLLLNFYPFGDSKHTLPLWHGGQR